MRPNSQKEIFQSFRQILKSNEFIIKLINDLKLSIFCEYGTPFPTLNHLDQLKEGYEQRVAELMGLSKLDKSILEYFITSLENKCLKDQSTFQSVQYMLKESFEQKAEMCCGCQVFGILKDLGVV